MRDCCLFVRHDTTPPNPATGFAHPKCYARDLKDCNETISREHYISESVLKLFGNEFIISGMPWIADATQKRVSSASLTGKMLCERHNGALSSLDEVAAKYYEFFTAEWSDGEDEVFLVRGYDLERWLLKMLCGLVVSGNATLDGEPLPSWTPPAEWLDVLFGSADVEAPAGLHYVAAPNYRATTESFHISPVFKAATSEPIALVFFVGGIGFLFALEELPPMRQPSITGASTRYRPKSFQLRSADSDGFREAHFGWPEGEPVILSVK